MVAIKKIQFSTRLEALHIIIITLATTAPWTAARFGYFSLKIRSAHFPTRISVITLSLSQDHLVEFRTKASFALGPFKLAVLFEFRMIRFPLFYSFIVPSFHFALYSTLPTFQSKQQLFCNEFWNWSMYCLL